MEKKRKSLWNAAVRAEYSDTTERHEQEIIAIKNGEHTAENLENIWEGLEEEEKFFIEYLFLSNKRAVIARYEDRLFSVLLEKGLLQIPPGVGTILMQYLQTTLSIPIAVWKSLHAQPGLFFSDNGKEKAHRLNELIQLFSGRVETLLKGTPPDSEAE